MGAARWCWAALLIASGFTAGTWRAQQPDRHWLNLNGNDWRQMEPDARQAYVRGFLAGAALAQAAAGARDTTGVRIALEQLGRDHRYRFPFGANVYESRINDYYWWKNHLPLPTWYAFLEVNTTLGRPIPDSLP